MDDTGAIMDRELILRKVGDKFDAYELFFLRERTKRFETRDRDLHAVEMHEEEGIALRGVKGQKMVFSYTLEKGEEAVKELTDNATMLVPFVEADESVFLPGAYREYPEVDLFDEGGLDVDDKEKTLRLVEMEAAILDYDRRIVTTRNCELQQEEIEIEIMNSNGLQVRNKKTMFTIFALCVAKEKDEVSWYDWAWSHALADIDMRALGVKIAQKTISLLGGDQISTGVYDGILTPRASSELMNVFSASFSAESLFKNKTRLKDKLGQQCFSDKVSIVDSGLVGMGASPFDGEGVPSKTNVLVSKGVFQGFLYDTYYGKKFSTPSTGNATRSSLKEPPVCGRRGFYVEKGAGDPYTLLTRGVIIEDLMGTHTANPITGDFSLGAVGYFVDRGVKSPFQGVIFAGNMFELLRNVKELGSDLEFYGTCGSPSLLVEGIKISGT